MITEQMLTLEMWLNGQFHDLFHEVKALQLRIRCQAKQSDVFKDFDHHVKSGKVSTAPR